MSSTTDQPRDRLPHPDAHQVMVPVTDGVSLRVLVREPAAPRGDAPLVLLIHGLASNARMWDGVGAALAASGYRSAAVDLRGHGLSSKPDQGYDFATICSDLCALLDHFGTERAVFVGQSWGGNVVVHAGYAHADRVVGVVAVDGGMIELSRRFPDWDDCATALRPPALAGLPFSRFEPNVRAMNRDWPETGINGSLANFELLPDGTIRPWLTLDRHMQILHALWEHQPSALYPHIDRPVLFLPADSGDVAWTNDKQQAVDAALAALGRGAVEWFRPAHHDLHAQHPQRCAEVIVHHIENGFLQ